NRKMIERILKDTIRGALSALSLQAPTIELEFPSDPEHGDYSTNVALILAKEAKKNPLDLAREIVEEILQKKPSEIESAEVAGPGFINFRLSREFLKAVLTDIQDSGEHYGKNEARKEEGIMVEYTDPNP